MGETLVPGVKASWVGTQMMGIQSGFTRSKGSQLQRHCNHLLEAFDFIYPTLEPRTNRCSKVSVISYFKGGYRPDSY
jgi:hypothetical protein